MSKRVYDGEGINQFGETDNFSGFTSDGSNNSASGSNFGSFSGRKILNPKRIRSGRPGSAKPLPPQPQAQAQPVLGSTQGFGFTFGGSNPAPSDSGFNFGGQQSTASQQTSGFTFGSQQTLEPQQPSQGFGFTPAVSNPFQSSNPAFGSGPQSTGFQGSIFNIQPSTQSNQPSAFNPFGNNTGNNQTNTSTTNNIFGNSQPNDAPKPLFNFGSSNSLEQSKPTFGFGQSTSSGTGFGSGAQSTSAPSSFNFNNNDAMNATQPTTSTSFSFGANPQQSVVPGTESGGATSGTVSSPFKFGDTASGSQNIFPSARPQSETTAKTPLFSFSTTSSGPDSASQTATASPAPAAAKPLFSFAPATQPNTTNIFGQAPSQTPASSTANVLDKSAGSSFGLGGSIFANSSSTKPSGPTASIFGTPAIPTATKAAEEAKPAISSGDSNVKAPLFTFKPAATTAEATSAQPAVSKPLFSFQPPSTAKADDAAQSAPVKPLFSFAPTNTSAANDQAKADVASDAAPKLMFGLNADEAQNKSSANNTRPNLFGETSKSSSTTQSFQVEQKKLPSFSFDGRTTSSALAQSDDATSTATGEASHDGLFKTPSTSISQAKPATESNRNLFSTTTAGEHPKPLFAFQPTTTNADAPKSLFNFGAAATKDTLKSDSSAGDDTSKQSMFASPSKANDSGSALNFPTSLHQDQGSNTAKPLFNWQPSSVPSESHIQNQAPIKPPNQNTLLNATPSKPAFSFQPSNELHQDISPGKSPFNFRPAVERSQLNSEGNASSPTKAIFPSAKFEKRTAGPVSEVPKTSTLDRAPKDKDIPVSFAEKWSTLRTGDLPTDEAVDILLHDWILQLEIPENTFTGMNMNQRDDLTWLWQQNSIDTAWDYHVKQFGNSDRNLLEVYRIVLNLKDAVDRYHQKSWTKNHLLVTPGIFDERLIRRMARQNIASWENGFRSEIKSLKRKADTDDAVLERQSPESVKRSKLDALGGSAARSTVAATEKTPSPEKHAAGNAGGLSANALTGFAAQTGFTTTPINPGKVNLLASAQSSAPDATPSPQRSKTSQLFASIASKPVEPVATASAPTRSLFERISRDSSGAPLREKDNNLPPADEQQEVEDPGADSNGESSEMEEDEGGGGGGGGGGGEEEEEEEEEYSDDVEEQESGDDVTFKEHTESTTEVAEGAPPSNLFSQSVSAAAKAKEAAIGSGGDNTWKPDSPIRFSKATGASSAIIPSSKPMVGFVPAGGMPQSSTENQASLKVSSQDSWQAPANPFGLFKKADKQTPAEEKREAETDAKEQAAAKFTMPRPPSTTSADSPLSVSSQDTWKAPSNPFGFFKPNRPAQDQLSAAPTVTLTAPSPQRPVAKPLFAMDSAISKPAEPVKPLFSFTPTAKTSDSEISKVTTQQPSLFTNAASAAPMKGIFGSLDAASAPKKPLFDFAKSDASGASAAPVSNAWLDFAKGINKTGSPAPSGASVFASLNTSLNPSRASSPAMSAVSTAAGDTDAEHNDDDDAPKEAQLDLGNANAGEENEDLLHSVRAKAYELYGKADEKKEWTVRGVGELRILKNKESGKVRAVLRADQSAKVLLNAGLLSAATYNLMSPKRVNFVVASAQGIPSRWFLQVGKEEDAKKLSEIFESNKAN